MPADDRPLADENSPDIGALIRLTLAGVLIIVLAALAIDNRKRVRVGWVFGEVHAPLFVVLLVAAIVGALIGWLILSRVRRSGRRNDRGD